jgi:hypothetical protein
MARRSCADLRLPGPLQPALRALLLPRPPRSCPPSCGGRRVQAREATRVSGLGLDSADSAETIEQQEDGSANPFNGDLYLPKRVVYSETAASWLHASELGVQVLAAALMVCCFAVVAMLAWLMLATEASRNSQ